MTDEPWHCGDGCPYRGCRECVWQGGDWPVPQEDPVSSTPTACDNRGGKDERPAASTADRSSHSDSLPRKEGVALMIATSPLPRQATARIGSVR